MKNMLKRIWRLISSLPKRLFLINLWWQKKRAQWHMEQDLAFLAAENDSIFSQSEEQMRLAMADEKDPEKKAALQRQINKYDSIKAIYGGTSDELALVKKYLAFISKTLK